MAIEHQAEVTIEHASVDDSQSTETVSFDNSKSLENQENLLNNYTAFTDTSKLCWFCPRSKSKLASHVVEQHW